MPVPIVQRTQYDSCYTDGLDPTSPYMSAYFFNFFYEARASVAPRVVVLIEPLLAETEKIQKLDSTNRMTQRARKSPW